MGAPFCWGALPQSAYCWPLPALPKRLNAGLLLGIVIAIALYCFALGLAATRVLPNLGVEAGRLWFLLLGLLVAALLTACLALFFSVFLHPLLATGATVMVLGAPLLIGVLSDKRWAEIVPVYPILVGFLRLSSPAEMVDGWLILLAFAETVGLWLLSAWLFSWKDIAVAVE